MLPRRTLWLGEPETAFPRPKRVRADVEQGGCFAGLQVAHAQEWKASRCYFDQSIASLTARTYNCTASGHKHASNCTKKSALRGCLLGIASRCANPRCLE